MRRITIFDTTLRDGEQSPGASLNLAEKIQIAHQLAQMKVDVIEAGFPITSPGDFEAVQAIAESVKGPVIAALARAVEKDIDRAAEAVRKSRKPRIHVFCATSEIHRKFKLRKAKSEIVRIAVDAVKHAKRACKDIEFSPEDASRTEPDFLAEVVEAVIAAGATTVNIPDTVGYAMPEQYAALIRYLKENVPNISKAAISVHCHNDLGLGVANSLAAVMAGADQVECTINGLGERAGNASLEEVVMAIKTRRDYFNCDTGIVTPKLFAASRMVSGLTGIQVQRNKAIVGENAFAHESGIHQDGMLKERRTYEIMRPEDVGVPRSSLVLGKHSGRHALRVRAEELGFKLGDEQLQVAYDRFKVLADKKKAVYDEDIQAILEDEFAQVEETYKLDSVQISSGTHSIPTATVRLVDRQGGVLQDASTGDGPVDATYKALERLTGVGARLKDYRIRAVTVGKDAQGEVSVEVEVDGRSITARGVSTDIIQASALAYLKAINSALARGGNKPGRKGAKPGPKAPSL